MMFQGSSSHFLTFPYSRSLKSLEKSEQFKKFPHVLLQVQHLRRPIKPCQTPIPNKPKTGLYASSWCSTCPPLSINQINAGLYPCAEMSEQGWSKLLRRQNYRPRFWQCRLSKAQVTLISPVTRGTKNCGIPPDLCRQERVSSYHQHMESLHASFAQNTHLAKHFLHDFHVGFLPKMASFN